MGTRRIVDISGPARGGPALGGSGSTGTFYGQAMTTGDIHTIAGTGTWGFSGDGGQATSAELYEPIDVAVGPSGNLLIADHYDNRIRQVSY